ncbi:type II toxin-antitoxin system HicA family toxin [Acetobacterium wieringae]|uniref:YcfA-like protein n=1 Tax=Acetobacterium wieringae TaxID=52694 RepID=A0A1F2PBY3_9FIRM|nr:type II toxin-antitoxin system HicA family toxin [Acetobacterium wieringae]OFV68930.1 YcfA-like protein [Acetobacterium wieringae]
MTFREAVKMIEKDGWVLDTVRGSHHHFKHPIKPGKVTIPIPKHNDLNSRTIKSIRKQAGLE